MTTNTNVNNLFPSGAVQVHPAIAGTATTTTVTNTDNSNAASIAYVKIETGGASAGDSFISESNSVVTFSHGLDNSDTDSYIIAGSTALGTTNVARCDTTGLWTYPSNACFSVNANGTDVADVTGDATVYYPVFSTEIYDIGSNYNTGTYTFTCPKSGIYIFTAAAHLTGVTAMTYAITAIRKNGSSFFENVQGHAASTVDGTTNVCGLCYCAAGDAITVSVDGEGGTKVVDFDGDVNFSWFQGALIS